MDASFSEDGSAVWLLLDRVENGRHVAVVARVDSPGRSIPGSAVDLGPDIRYSWFAGLSGDGGSQVAIGSWLGRLDGDVVSGPTAIVPRTANSGTSLHAGGFCRLRPRRARGHVAGRRGVRARRGRTHPDRPTRGDAAAEHAVALIHR